MNFGAVKDVLGQLGDQVLDRAGERSLPDPGAFLSNYITQKLPEFIIGAATKIAGREDGSGFIANEALKAGKDPIIGSFIK